MSIPYANPSTTFAFSEADAARISSLAFNIPDFLTSGAPTTNFNDLERIHKKRIALELHSATLNHYFKENIIPRGLRCHLTPTLFAEDKSFCEKFERILNKASFDVILLTIERIHVELTTLGTEISTLENQIFLGKTSEAQVAIKEQIVQKIEPFKSKLIDKKKQKLQRDITDYSTGRVYRWQLKNSRDVRPVGYPPRQQTGYNSRQYSDTSLSDSDSSNHFLGGRIARNQQGEGGTPNGGGPEPGRRYYTRQQGQQRRRRNPL